MGGVCPSGSDPQECACSQRPSDFGLSSLLVSNSPPVLYSEISGVHIFPESSTSFYFLILFVVSLCNSVAGISLLCLNH